MGDECHNRNRAGTSLFLRAITPALIRTCPDRERVAEVFEFVERNDHFFLNLSMAAGKPCWSQRRASRVDGVDGDGAQWHGFRDPRGEHATAVFVAPAGMVQGLYLPGSQRTMPTPISEIAR